MRLSERATTKNTLCELSVAIKKTVHSAQRETTTDRELFIDAHIEAIKTDKIVVDFN